MSHPIYIIAVFLHIVSACMWLGGMLFLIFVLIPSLKKNPDKVAIITQVSLKFRSAGLVALLVLLITGTFQLYYRGVQWNLDYFMSTQFGKLAGLKILVFISILAISLIHDYYIGLRAIEAWKNQPEDPKTIRLRKLSRLLGRINFLLALVAVCLGITLVRGW